MSARFGRLLAAVLLILLSASGARAAEGLLAARSADAAAIERLAAVTGFAPVIVELAQDPRAAAGIARAVSPEAADRLAVEASARAVDGFLARLGHRPAPTAEARLRGLKRLRYAPVVAFLATPSDIRALARDPAVRRIWRDRPVRPSLDVSVPLIGVPAVSATGQTGSDAIVAVLDTGVATTHPFLAGRIVAEACFSTTSAYPSQSLCPGGASQATSAGAGNACPTATYGSACAHGTHVAGIAAGNSNGATPKQGVAAGASVFAVQVFSWFPGQRQVLSWTSDQLKALEHVYARRNDFSGKRIAAVNMSLGGGSNAGLCGDSPHASVVARLRAAGILTVIAAGNDGYTAAMGAPACTPGAVSVASTTKADQRSSFSNISPVTTLYAPGSDIRASVPGNVYAVMSGTSMAAPHVAGAVALLRSAFPDATADEIEQAMTSTGVAVARPGGGTLPRLDVEAAFAALGGGDLPVISNLVVSPSDAVEIRRVGNALDRKSFGVMVSARSGWVGWTLSGVPAWLKASATKGTATPAPRAVTFTVKAPAVQSGTLAGELVFTPSAGGTPPIRIPVSLVWVPQTLSLTPGDAVEVTSTNAMRASPAAFQTTLAVDVGTAAWKMTKYPRWLKPSLRAGTVTPAGVPLTFTVVPSAARVSGEATVEIAMTAGSKHTVVLPVSIEAVSQKLQALPQTDTLISQASGAASPSTVSVRLSTTAGSSGWKVTGVPAWLTPSAVSGTTDTDGVVVSFAVTPQANTRMASATLKFFLDGMRTADGAVLIRLQPPAP
jgi:subtilisin family serine protease